MLTGLPDASSATEDAVHRTRQANRKSADAAREGAAMLGFGDEMDVVILHGVLDDPKITARRGRQQRGAPTGRHGATGDSRSQSQRGG